MLVVGITTLNSVSFIIVISAQILQSTLWILKPDVIHDCNLVVNIYSSEAEQPTNLIEADKAPSQGAAVPT